MDDILLAIGTLSVLFLPQIIGLFSVLFLEKKKHDLALALYWVMVALSIIPCLFVSTIGFWSSLGAYIGAEFARGFIYIGASILLVAQLAFLIMFFKKSKIRKILVLTLLSTPALIIILMNLAAVLFGEGIYIS